MLGVGNRIKSFKIVGIKPKFEKHEENNELIVVV